MKEKITLSRYEIKNAVRRVENNLLYPFRETLGCTVLPEIKSHYNSDFNDRNTVVRFCNDKSEYVIADKIQNPAEASELTYNYLQSILFGDDNVISDNCGVTVFDLLKIVKDKVEGNEEATEYIDKAIESLTRE